MGEDSGVETGRDGAVEHGRRRLFFLGSSGLMEQMSAASRIFLLTTDKTASTLLSNVEGRMRAAIY
jgi:hypothetical protein